MEKIRLAVIFGGMSSEHEVSCVSCASVLDNINSEKYEIIKIGITKDGRWLLTEADSEEIRKGKWSGKTAFLSPDRSIGAVVTEDGYIKVDCIFPAVHGRMCEDGVLQGLLELSGIPYVGSGVSSSACSMDKSITKLIAKEEGIRQAEFVLVRRWELEDDMENILFKVEKKLGEYPFFIKPAREGSSVGISKAGDRKSLEQGLLEAARFDDRILVEETVEGREIETAVLGNDKLIVGEIGEILSCNEFYDYEAKYNDIGSETRIADDIPQKLQAEIKEKAKRVFKALDCRGMARVDFFLTEDNEIILNEINTLPGFTSISMYPKMMEAAGVSYSRLIDRLIELAME